MPFEKGNKLGYRYKPGPDAKRNAKGRPKGKTITERVRDLLEHNPDRAQAIVEAGVQAAEKGDFQFWKYLCDRMEGTPAQTVAVQGDLTHTFLDPDQQDKAKQIIERRISK